MNIVAKIAYDRRVQIGAGQGMNSEVYLAHDPQLGGQIVAKEIPKSNIDTAVYFREAQAMFASAHRNVVRIHYACQTPTHVCLAMPYFSNGSLQDRLTSGGLSLTEAIRVSDGVLSGLGHVHTQQLVHFDVKPTNIFFDDTNNPLVADFGQAREMVSHGVAKAPPMYRNAFPPEVVRNGVAAATADIYQTGLTLYRVLHGEGFYQSEVQRAVNRFSDIGDAILRGKFPNRRRFLPHIPRRLCTIIRRALSTDPSARYQSAYEFAGALARVRISLDWRVVGTGPDFSWCARREGKRDLVVDLRQDNSGWAVEAHTENGKRRRTTVSRWRSGLTSAEADKHLVNLFSELNGRG